MTETTLHYAPPARRPISHDIPWMILFAGVTLFALAGIVGYRL